MNLHPLLVHFPIALLMLYALLEVGIPILAVTFRFFKLQGSALYKSFGGEMLFTVKGFLVIVGALTAIPTLLTGEIAEERFAGSGAAAQAFFETSLGKLIEMHSAFATASVILFAVIAVGYILTLPYFLSRFANVRLLQQVRKILQVAPLKILLAILGLVLLTTTGALGGSISHGPETDPVAGFVYQVLIGE